MSRGCALHSRPRRRESGEPGSARALRSQPAHTARRSPGASWRGPPGLSGASLEEDRGLWLWAEVEGSEFRGPGSSRSRCRPPLGGLDQGQPKRPPRRALPRPPPLPGAALRPLSLGCPSRVHPSRRHPGCGRPARTDLHRGSSAGPPARLRAEASADEARRSARAPARRRSASTAAGVGRRVGGRRALLETKTK